MRVPVLIAVAAATLVVGAMTVGKPVGAEPATSHGPASFAGTSAMKPHHPSAPHTPKAALTTARSQLRQPHATGLGPQLHAMTAPNATTTRVVLHGSTAAV